MSTSTNNTVLITVRMDSGVEAVCFEHLIAPYYPEPVEATPADVEATPEDVGSMFMPGDRVVLLEDYGDNFEGDEGTVLESETKPSGNVLVTVKMETGHTMICYDHRIGHCTYESPEEGADFQDDEEDDEDFLEAFSTSDVRLVVDGVVLPFEFKTEEEAREHLDESGIIGKIYSIVEYRQLSSYKICQYAQEYF